MGKTDPEQYRNFKALTKGLLGVPKKSARQKSLALQRQKKGTVESTKDDKEVIAEYGRHGFTPARPSVFHASCTLASH